MILFRKEVDKDSNLLKGKYCLTFHCHIKIPGIVTSLLASRFLEFAIEKVDYVHPEMKVYIHVKANPIPIAVIIAGIGSIIILGLVVMTLTKVERIVEAPGGFILAAGFGVMLLTGGLKGKT